jgi:hypothetical protein
MTRLFAFNRKNVILRRRAKHAVSKDAKPDAA